MADQPTAPKILKLKIRIPALKRDPPPPPPPPPEPEPEPERYDSEDNDEDDDEDQSPSQSGSPISLDQADNDDDDIETAYDVLPPPSTSASTQPTFTPTLKLKFSTALKRPPAAQGSSTNNVDEPLMKKPKKPRARPKLFGRVTERKGPGPAVGPDGQPIFHVKKPPKLKSISEILPRLLARIKKKDHYGIFLQPVDTTAFPHYLDIIKRPMDLSTMERILESGRYRSLDQFAADFRIMINNCKTFNPAPSLYYTEATKLETFGNDAISQAAGQLMDPADEPEFVPMDVDARATPSAPPPPQQQLLLQSQPASGPPSPAVTTTLSGRTVKRAVYHERTRSDTLDSYVAPPTPNAGGSSTQTHTPSGSISFAHGEWQKQLQGGQSSKEKGGAGAGGGWVRGPYKKTVVRDVPGVGPGGELPGSMNGVGEFPAGSEWGKVALALEIRGKRYRTKKERLEMEKRGMPTLWDGSIDYAQRKPLTILVSVSQTLNLTPFLPVEDPFTVLHHFTPDPFQAPWLQALSDPPPPTNPDSEAFPIFSSAGKLADRTADLASRLEAQPPPHFITRGYSTRASVPAITLDSEADDAVGAQKYELPERWMGTRDFGVLPQIRERPGDRMVKVEVELEEVAGSSGFEEEARDGLEYIRDTVYGGTEGLAYARSVMEFVNGASASAAAARTRLVEGEGEDAKPGKAMEEEQEEEWEEPPGGLGMSLQDWITQNVLQPATGGTHGVLATTADRLRATTSTNSPADEDEDEKKQSLAATPDPISAQIHQSLHINPAVRSHLAGIVARRKEKINLSALIRDPMDLRATDDVWDPEASAASDSTTVLGGFDPRWAERALRIAGERVEAYVRRDGGAGGVVKMEVDDEEDEEVRKLRFNLLALARVVPFSEGVTFA
ncbi:hypothetical protein FRC04_009104 [Tulasnella sp. 424]|nr:hypothetical protein FRC04_009104 [Tulasnella sp. 424]KAG8974674.1 hypothetical protein FRC05_007008 [Tulasnella sp. 425]